MLKINFILLSFLSFTVLSFSTNSKVPTSNQIQGRLNIVNGYSAECVMHKFYTNSGWIRIEGEIGRNGIDGLYYKKKNGVIREVLVAESKWNKSRLAKSGKNKLIKQMSQQWVLRKLERLQTYQPLPEYAVIKKLVQYDQYRARLFRLFPRGQNKIQIHVFKIKNKGSNNYDVKILNKLDAITMTKPKNTFQKDMLNAYNACRVQALHKYFPILTNQDIELLVKDNYLQKQDLKHFFYRP